MVKKILDLPVDDSNGTKKKTAGENDNLGIALMDAKKKHQEAKQRRKMPRSSRIRHSQWRRRQIRPRRWPSKQRRI